jgi:hypothetical protein
MAEGVEGLLRDKTRRPGKPPLSTDTVQRVVDLALGDTTVQEKAISFPTDARLMHRAREQRL